MDAGLHLALRKTVAEWITTNGSNADGKVIYDAPVVAGALLEVVAEVVVSGSPTYRHSFVATLHTALDEYIAKKAELVDQAIRREFNV